MNNLLIYSTEASAYFSELIANGLKIKLSEIIREKFGDGELYHRINISGRGELFSKSAIMVASTHSDYDFNELEKIGTALANLGTERRIFVIPFFGYSTMERAVLPGEAVSAKINARRLSGIPNSGQGNIFLMLDLHVSGILHYFEGDCLCHELYGDNILSEAIKELKLDNFVFGTADLGRAKWVETFADKFKADIVFVRKSRHFKETEVLDVIGDVAGKNIIICDDMTRSGGTLIKAAKAYLKHGANKIYAILSHLALNNADVIENLENSPIGKIITTNSHPMSQHQLVKNSQKIIIKDISPEFIAIIKKIIGES